MIQAFSPYCADRALRVCVLPRRSRRCQNFLYADGCDLPAEVLAELAVLISDQVLPCVVQSNGLENLPCCPLRCRKLGHVGMQNLPTIMAEYDEDKEHPEVRGRDREKVCGDDVFGVIFEESAPCL